MYTKRISLIGLLLALTSCASNSTQLPQPPNVQPAQPQHVSPPPAPAGVPSYQSNAKPADQPTFPKGAQYTIYCARVEGPMHVEQATRTRDELKRANPQMKDWYVIHQDTQSLLYYGYYRAIADPNDPKESSRAVADRQKIDAMTDAAGNRPFRQALFVTLDAPDPDAPPEWNLANTSGAYTLQIGVYKGSPERKQAAVDTVRQARKQGIEAYYLHGDTASLVCIGCWPESAVRINEETLGAHGDPMQPKMYVPETGDAQVNQNMENVARQSGMQLIRPKFEILDPTLKAAIAQYPYNSVNGMEMKHMVEGQEQRDHSLVMRIPRNPNDPRFAQMPEQHTAPQQRPQESLWGPGLSPPGGAPVNSPAPAAAAPVAPAAPKYDPQYRPAIPNVLDGPAGAGGAAVQMPPQPMSPSLSPATPTLVPPPPPASNGRLRSIGD